MPENKRLTPTVIIYVDGQRLNPMWEGAFRSLNLNDPLNDIGKARINFVLANPEELDTDTFAPGSNVSILLGYKDDMHEVFNGQALDKRGAMSSSGVSYTVIASTYLNQLNGGERYRSFENLSPPQAIEKVLSEYGLQAHCDNFGTVREHWSAEGMTDWEFIRYQASKYGKDIYCFGKKVYIKELMDMHREEIIFEREKSLISYDVSMSFEYPAVKAQVVGHDMLTEESFVGECSLSEVTPKIGGDKDMTYIRRQSGGEPIVHTHIDTGVKDIAGAKEIAAAIMRRESFKFIRANGEGEGTPKLAAGALVTIKGMEPGYAGEFIANKVEHEISTRDGYVTRFNLKRNMVDEETVRLMNPGALRIHTPPQSSLSVAEKEITPMPFVANEAAVEENYETLKREILSVKCLDADGNEATLCSGNEPLTFEAVCNASVGEGAIVTFNVYREGDDPAQVEPIEIMSAIVRQGRARFELDLETAGSIAGRMLGGLVGGEQGARTGEAFGGDIGRGLDTLVRRFLVRADSEGCEEVQSACVEVVVPGAPIWLVHGAINPRFRDHWRDDAFRSYLKRIFGYDYFRARWRSVPEPHFIIEGARIIAQQIIQWRRKNEGTSLILIGFSHGGNVNKEIVNLLSQENPPIFVNTLINIGTPIRPDFTLNARVGQHINVYNEDDDIQVFGSQHIVTEEVFDARSGVQRPIQRLVTPEDSRRYTADIHVVTQNIPISPKYPLHRIFANHEFMHACEEIWVNYIQEHIILPPPN